MIRQDPNWDPLKFIFGGGSLMNSGAGASPALEQMAQQPQGGFLQSPGFAQFAGALRQLGEQDTARRDKQSMLGLFANRPEIAQAYYGAQDAKEARDIQRQTALSRLAKLRANPMAEAPSAIQEYEYYRRLTPAQKREYLQAKRAERVVDLGGEYGVVNPVDSAVAPIADKTLEPAQQPSVIADQTAARTAAGITAENTANAQATLGDIEAASEQSLADIQSLLDHPGLSDAVGVKGLSSLGGLMAEPFEGTEAANFKSLLNKLKGGTFLQAFKSLKGGGAITELEGKKAEEAIARLDTAQSEVAFKSALQDYADVIRAGLERSRTKARGQNLYQPGPLSDADFNAEGIPPINIPPPVGGPAASAAAQRVVNWGDLP